MALVDPAVALTDFALAAENFVFAVLTWRVSRGREGTERLARWCALFFLFVGLSSALGGAFHGFIREETSLAGQVLWRTTLLIIGLVAVSGANAAAQMVCPERARGVIAAFAASAFIVYTVVVLFVSQEFRNAIVIYLPATLFLLVAFVIRYARLRTLAPLAGAIGMVLTFVAAGVQQSSLALPSMGLNHNAIYHLIQGAALVLIFGGMRAAIGALRVQDGPVRAHSSQSQA